MVWFPTGGGSERVRPRHIAIVALVLGLIVVAFLGTRLRGEDDARLDAQHRAEVAAAQIRARVDQGSSLAESLSQYTESVAGSPDASQEFESTVSQWLSPAGFPAAGWIEQVPGSQRAAYESRTGNPIVTVDRQLRIVPAGPRSSYLPATLVSGIPPMETPGIDLGEESGVAAAVSCASALDEVCATPLTTLLDGEEGLFLIEFAPNLSGGIIRPAFVALFVSEPSLRAAVTDTTPVRLAVGGTSAGGLGGPAAAVSTFTEAGQRFQVAVPLESVVGAAVFLPWIVLATGLVLAVLAGALSVNAARRAKAKAEVDRLFTLTPDLITVAGFDGFWKRVNPAFETRLGYTEREALARPYMEFVHPDDRERTEAQALSLTEGKTMLAFENRLVCKDGSSRWIEWAATAVPSEGVLYEVGRDVTERRQAESELRRLAGEQAARRRVATLVATGVSPAEVFSSVAEEVERLFDAKATAIGRREHDGEIAVVASSGTMRDVLPVGSRLKVESAWALATVIRTGRSARADGYGRASESVHPRAERLGIRSAVAIPIMVEGSLWGAIAAGTDREQFPADAEQRMAEFTDLVATAIANADSRSQLAASRRRIVAATDEARRQIERNLHDGTQQRLVSLGLAVRAAEADVPPDRRGLQAELSGIATGLMDAVAELREISRGVHPAILSEAGLGPALRTLVRRSTTPVDLDVRTDTRLSEPIEVAAYFVASEALANAAKHAQASRMEVSLATRNGSLVLSIRDDGIGGANPGRGSGLVGLRDRVEALGGTIRIDSPAGGGTSLVVTLPIDVEPVGVGTGSGTK
jgi:PAS domain S-box-containing protein